MDSQVQEVKSKTDIVSIISDRIELKKAGRNYKASCPFHGEKTASFMVSPELQIFKCFGCSEILAWYTTAVKLWNSEQFDESFDERWIGVQTLELVYPLNFYFLLTETVIKNVDKYLREDRIDPYGSYQFGSSWIGELNR